MEAYRSAAIKAALPPLSDSNGPQSVSSQAGFCFPAFLVMERGLTLSEWLYTEPTPLGILCMFGECAALLATLHAAGRIHRDLKPDNVLLMLHSQKWKLIDFGIAAPSGAT